MRTFGYLISKHIMQLDILNIYILKHFCNLIIKNHGKMVIQFRKQFLKNKNTQL